ncbi:MAG: TraV family lipoprotein, partial [Thermaurantiacus sp.]
MIRAFLVACLAFALAACAGTKRNVASSWRCSATQGTCAPVAVIDDAAVARLGVGPAAGPSAPRSEPLPAPAARQPLLAPFLDGPPRRTPERVLRIVFPAHIDAQGVYHEAAAVHAVVETPAWDPSAPPTRPLEREASALPSSPPLRSAPRLATPEEVARKAAPSAAAPVPPVAAPVSVIEPGPDLSRAAEGFPPFPATAGGQASGAPAPVAPGAGASLSSSLGARPFRTLPSASSVPSPATASARPAAAPSPPSAATLPSDPASSSLTRELNLAQLARLERLAAGSAANPAP